MDKQKIIRISIGLLTVFLIILFLLFLFTQKNKVSQQSAGASDQHSSTPHPVSNREYSLQEVKINQNEKKRTLFSPQYARIVALKTLGWLNKTRIYKVRLDNPTSAGEFICDGGYGAEESCKANGACEIRMVGNNIGLIATWAQYKYYEQVNRDDAILKIIENDLKTYGNTKKISAVQPIIWNFKLIYDLWSGTVLNDVQKQLARAVLYRIQHDPYIIEPVERQVKDMTNTPTALTFDTATPYAGTPLTERDNIYSIFSSEYVYSSSFVRDTQVENDQPYLNTAVGLYNEALRRYMASNGNPTEFSPYMFGIAALDLYRATGNSSYLNTASRLADRHIKSDCRDEMMICASRIYFYHELFKVHAKQSYIQARNELLQKILSEKYDSPEVAGERLGKYAFYTERKAKEESLIYELIPNALLVQVLIEL